jgi:hypothetical protein
MCSVVSKEQAKGLFKFNNDEIIEFVKQYCDWIGDVQGAFMNGSNVCCDGLDYSSWVLVLHDPKEAARVIRKGKADYEDYADMEDEDAGSTLQEINNWVTETDEGDLAYVGEEILELKKFVPIKRLKEWMAYAREPKIVRFAKGMFKKGVKKHATVEKRR